MITKYGFPKDKVLFAGVVNGKNIWRSNYKCKLELINSLKQYVQNIVLSTSCSLLHVPYTVKNETKLSNEVLKHFAFAYEKLNELRELCTLEAKNKEEVAQDLVFIKNQELFTNNELRCDKKGSIQKTVG